MSEYKENTLVNYILNDLYDLWSLNRSEQLEDKWNKNRAAFSRDGATFDNYAGVWRSYQGKGEPRPATEEEFDESPAGAITSEDVNWRSDTFMSLTKQKVVAGVNLVNDQMFKGGQIPMGFDATVSEYASSEEFDAIRARRDEVEKHIVRMMKRTKALDDMRLTVFCAGLYSIGFFKKSIEQVENRSTRMVNGRLETNVTTEDMLSGQNVTPWDMFWDMQFDNLDDGDGVIHRDFIKPSLLRDYIEEGEEYYWIPEALEEVLRDIEDRSNISAGATPLADKSSVSPIVRDLSHVGSDLEYLECWVRVPTKYVEMFEDEGTDIDEVAINGNYSYILAGIVNKTLVRFEVVDKGDHPFYKTIWEVDPDSSSGISIADNVEGEQMVLNGMVRAFEDNKKLSANIIFASNKMALNGDFKNWYPGKDIECDNVKDVNQAINQLVIQDVGESLVNSINMYLQFADASSNIPRDQQGMPSANPQTAYEIQQRLERSGKYIGTVITEFDKRLLEPYANDCYEWLSMQPDFDDIGGAFKINALGFASYEARAMRLQSMMSMLALLAQHPEWQKRVSDKFFLEEIFKAQGIDYRQAVKSDEALQQEAEAEENSPERQLQMKQMSLSVEELSSKVDKLNSEVELNKAKADNLDAGTDDIDSKSNTPPLDTVALAQESINEGNDQINS